MGALREIANDAWDRFKDVGKQVQNLSEKTKSIDTIMKAAEKTLQAADYIIQDSTADEATKVSVRKGYHVIGDARKVTSFFNIFMGVLPAMARNIEHICDLVQSLFVIEGCSIKINEDDCRIEGKRESHFHADPGKGKHKSGMKYFTAVKISVTELEGDEFGEFQPKDAEYNISAAELLRLDPQEVERKPAKFSIEVSDDKIYKGTVEKVLGLITEFFRFVAGLTYTVCFGVLRPISFIGRFTELGARAKAMGNKFPHVMTVNHAAGFIATIADLARVFHVYGRSEQSYAKFKRLMDKIEDAALNLSEKFCELGADAVSLGAAHLRGPTGQMRSPWGALLIVFNGGVIIFGLVRLVRELRSH